MKHKPSYNRARWLSATLLVAAVAALVSARMHGMSREQDRKLGCLTAQQVLGLSEPICRTVVGGTGPLELAVDPSHGRPNTWTFVCSEPSGRDLCTLKWNADTGELSQLTAVCRKAQLRSGALLSSARAIEIGRFWLRSLRFGPERLQWRLCGVPVCIENHHWSLNFTAEGRHAYLELEAHTGNLICAISQSP
jgi:hypothetical protein